jgi:predicted MFS family arabinose efflux permease
MQTHTVTRKLVLLLAVVCGVTTANAYYAQPMLGQIASALHASDTGVSLLITAGQVGTAIGLLFLVPAADIVRRRSLLTALFVADTIALAAMAIAPGVGLLTVLSLVVGLAGVAIPIITAYAASLADDSARGRVLGTIMAGVLLGILLSRTVASLIAEFGGWRVVYVLAATAMASVTVAVLKTLPNEPAGLSASYPDQLRAVLTQFRDQPILRSRCLVGASVMATFTGFWTTVAFLLSRPPFSYSQLDIGLFALSGVAGALTTSFGGRFIDRYRYWRWQSTGIALVVLGVSFVVLGMGGSSLLLLVIGAIVMDAAIQAIHVTNQSVIYELNQDARSRLASGYMTSFAVGGATGSTVFASAYEAAGWLGACLAGGGFTMLALLVWLTGSRSERLSSTCPPPALSEVNAGVG